MSDLSSGDRLDVKVVKELPGGKKYYTKIGTLFVNRDGSCTIKLDALPLDGNLYASRPLEKRPGQYGGGGGRSYGGGGGFGGQQRRNNGPPRRVTSDDFPSDDNAPDVPPEDFQE